MSINKICNADNDKYCEGNKISQEDGEHLGHGDLAQINSGRLGGTGLGIKSKGQKEQVMRRKGMAWTEIIASEVLDNTLIQALNGQKDPQSPEQVIGMAKLPASLKNVVRMDGKI